MTVYETGISGELTSSMIDRLRHYLDELKDLQFVILLGVRVVASINPSTSFCHYYDTNYNNRGPTILVESSGQILY
jgi:hypothetical protein